MMEIRGKALTITAVPEKAVYKVTLANGDTWEMSGRAYVELSDRTKLYLDEAEDVQTAERKTGTWQGIGADYTLPGGLVLHTLVYVENTRDDVYFVNRLEGDRLGQIRFVSFPSAVQYDVPEYMGYTVLPRMQGTIIPAGHPIELRFGVDEGQDTRQETGIIYERNAYIPLFGQVRYRQPNTKIGRGGGYMLVYDTPYDANYALQGENIQPLFKTSLGRMSYPRKLLYRFFEDCDYNDFAHSYREYLEERGQIVTLAEKCAKNPAVERLLGQPIIHEGIATHISEQSHFYNKEDPASNDHYITFA
ncbi:MAG: hypothetical protein IKY52_12830, partial [Clostridia bacterium]|nr:hypothetical protein [Clostridia bacterium]